MILTGEDERAMSRPRSPPLSGELVLGISRRSGIITRWVMDYTHWSRPSLPSRWIHPLACAQCSRVVYSKQNSFELKGMVSVPFYSTEDLRFRNRNLHFHHCHLLTQSSISYQRKYQDFGTITNIVRPRVRR